MELRIVEARHAVVNEAYDPAQRKFVPAKQFADDAEVIVFAYPTGKRGQVGYTADCKAGGVYDECGYIIAQEPCDWEELEAAAKRLDLGHYQYRAYVYLGGPNIIFPTLRTHAGGQTELRFGSMIDRWAEFLSRKEGVQAERIGDKAVQVLLDEEG